MSWTLSNSLLEWRVPKFSKMWSSRTWASNSSGKFSSLYSSTDMDRNSYSISPSAPIYSVTAMNFRDPYYGSIVVNVPLERMPIKKNAWFSAIFKSSLSLRLSNILYCVMFGSLKLYRSITPITATTRMKVRWASVRMAPHRVLYLSSPR